MKSCSTNEKAAVKISNKGGIHRSKGAFQAKRFGPTGITETTSRAGSLQLWDRNLPFHFNKLAHCPTTLQCILTYGGD